MDGVDELPGEVGPATGGAGLPQAESARPAQGANPYATGGGGVAFEHVYAGTLLAALLCGDVVVGLGEDQVLRRLTFQARSESPVDDLLLAADTRTVAVGVRRRPRVVPSNQDFVRLLSTFLRASTERRGEIETGRWGLGLVVADLREGRGELAELANIARASDTDEAFRLRVGQRGTTRRQLRDRLTHLDKAVALAAAGAGLEGTDPMSLTWPLLRALEVIGASVENGGLGRATAVSRLRDVTVDPEAAAVLFELLCARARDYAQAGATVDEAKLRADLRGHVRLLRSARTRTAWEALDALDETLRARTGKGLRGPAGDGENYLELERGAEREALAAALLEAGQRSGLLVVTGDPDVGKSALSLAAAESLEDADVVGVPLDELPAQPHELEARLGAPVRDVIGGMGVSPRRLIIVDGAESVLQGRGETLGHLARAAVAAGIGLVAITRADAESQVIETLENAARAAGADIGVVVHKVPPLGDEDRARVVEVFPSLLRLARDPRSAWLLGRPGLLELLVRGEAYAALPDGALSEADVFNAIWSGLVRQGEVMRKDGATPDGREAALIGLGRRELLGEERHQLDGRDLASLRSDGLLATVGDTFPWQNGDRFASDLVRDLAVARILVREGLGVLKASGAPRWALRAARIACQSRLAGNPDVEAERARLQGEFDAIAVDLGARWAEVPWDAVLTGSDPSNVLGRASAALMSDRAAGLHSLMRIVFNRHGGEAGLETVDPVVARPVISFVIDHLSEVRAVGGETEELAWEFILAWLAGLTVQAGKDVQDAMRQHVRDAVLALGPRRGDDAEIQSLAVLGPDLDDRTEELLRGLAANAPHCLYPAVEREWAVISMANNRPELLLALAEAYYIEHPQTPPYGSLMDDGVRDHRRRGLFGSMAGWYFGPFWSLLKATPREALTFINRLLDHAARVRVAPGPWDDRTEPYEEIGLSFELPAVGERRCVGDPHVWTWYRGCSVGPYAAMSALLAVERWADQVLALGLPLPVVVARLLDGCNNLAMPGLVVGLLVRHLDLVSDELDPFLVRPEIWDLEFARLGFEQGGIHVQGEDPEDTPHRERRIWTLRDVAAMMVLGALTSGEEARAEHLRQLARRLRDTDPGRERSPGDEEGALSRVEGYAAALDPDNYHLEEQEGRIVLAYEAPAELVRAQEGRQRGLDAGREAWRLFTRYGSQEDRRPADLSTLLADVEVARGLDLAAGMGPPNPADAPASVAAAALIAHAEGRATLERDSIAWAARTLIDAVRTKSDDFDGSMFSMGADRSAAAGLPSLFLPVFNEAAVTPLDSPEYAELSEALLALQNSSVAEVRMAVADGMEPLWSAPCGPDGDAPAACRHRLVLAGLEVSLRQCRMGPFNFDAQRRLVSPIDDDLREGLAELRAEDMLVTRLTAPIVALAACADSTACVREEARTLLYTALEPYLRGAAHWEGELFDWRNEGRGRVAMVLLHLAAGGDPQPLLAHVDGLVATPLGLSNLLGDLCRAATRSTDDRRALRAVWPGLMEHLLDAFEAEPPGPRRREDDAMAALLPVPTAEAADPDIDRTLAEAREGWIQPTELGPRLERWLRLSSGRASCADALVRLLRVAPLEFQREPGLEWMERLIADRYDQIARRSWLLPEWLDDVAAGEPPSDTVTRLRRLVDGLAAAGDHRALKLQAVDE
jgi:Mrp family chromosome partitioning ATPase